MDTEREIYNALAEMKKVQFWTLCTLGVVIVTIGVMVWMPVSSKVS